MGHSEWILSLQGPKGGMSQGGRGGEGKVIIIN